MAWLRVSLTSRSGVTEALFSRDLDFGGEVRFAERVSAVFADDFIRAAFFIEVIEVPSNAASIAVDTENCQVRLVHSPDQYVRGVRHQFEQREGASAVQEESPIEISGQRFVHATVKVVGQGRTHYRGIYTTFLNGYILSLGG